MGNGESGIGMKYFAPQQPDVASAIASLIKRLANRPNLTQSRHPVDVTVAKLTLKNIHKIKSVPTPHTPP